jgi:hypothetical protein
MNHDEFRNAITFQWNSEQCQRINKTEYGRTTWGRRALPRQRAVEASTSHRVQGDADCRGAPRARLRRPACRAPPPSLTASTHRSSTSEADAPPPVSEKKRGRGGRVSSGDWGWEQMWGSRVW